MKRIIPTILALVMALSLFACSGETLDPADTGSNDIQGIPGNSAVVLTFSGTKLETSVKDAGISVEGNAFVITREGSYELRGDLSNGQIRVAVGKEAKVELILNNFTASCDTSAPLYIESAKMTVIQLAPGSVNSLTDAVQYQFPSPAEDKPNACIYSADDLTIQGSGTLNVNGQYNNGIGCKNDLRIKECTLNVQAPTTF